MNAGTKAVLSVLFMFLMLAGQPVACAEVVIPQPSPANDTLYLHYNQNSSWMNAEKNQTNGVKTAGWYGPISISFPMIPGLNRSTFLILNASNDWVARFHVSVTTHSVKYTTIQNANASITVGNYSYMSRESEVVDDNYTFYFSDCIDFIRPEWEINLTLKYMGPAVDIGLPLVTIYTDGSSYLKIPITATDIDTDHDNIPNSLDPDDDNDGHNDIKDAYPQDPTKWENPEPVKTFVPGFDVLPAFVALGVSISLVFRKRRCL